MRRKAGLSNSSDDDEEQDPRPPTDQHGFVVNSQELLGDEVVVNNLVRSTAVYSLKNLLFVT